MTKVQKHALVILATVGALALSVATTAQANPHNPGGVTQPAVSLQPGDQVMVNCPGRVKVSRFSNARLIQCVAVAPAAVRTRKPTPTPTVTPTVTGGIWAPTPGQQWQWMLSAVPSAANLAADPSIRAWDVDGADASASTVAAIHAAGAGAVCYFSAGTWENWRSDAAKFPTSVQGRGNGWPGEMWLDIRAISTLEPLMVARMQACKTKGFDAVEPDNVDGFSNSTGFPLTSADQLAYNRMLANDAHALGLGVALKNDVEQVPTLAPSFDWMVNEECYAYNECAPYAAVRATGKAVWIVEYETDTTSFCPKALASGFDAMWKKLALDYARTGC
jgi:hypothetical protein